MAAVLDLVRNLFAGLRLAAFLPVRRDQFRLAACQLPLLVLFGLALDGAYQWTVTDTSRSFNIYGVTSISAVYLAVLLTIALIAALQRRIATAIPLTIALLSAGPAMFVFNAVTTEVDAESTLYGGWFAVAVFVVSLVWTAAIAFRSVRLICRTSARRAIGPASLYTVMAAGIAIGIPQQPMWYDDEFNWDRVVNVWESAEAYSTEDED